MFGNESVEKFLNQIFSVNMSGTINLIESTKVTRNQQLLLIISWQIQL